MEARNNIPSDVGLRQVIAWEKLSFYKSTTHFARFTHTTHRHSNSNLLRCQKQPPSWPPNLTCKKTRHYKHLFIPRLCFALDSRRFESSAAQVYKIVLDICHLVPTYQILYHSLSPIQASLSCSQCDSEEIGMSYMAFDGDSASLIMFSARWPTCVLWLLLCTDLQGTVACYWRWCKPVVESKILVECRLVKPQRIDSGGNVR